MSTSPTRGDDRAAIPTFGFESLLEAQTRLWNHLLDANRSLWSFYTPWLPTGAWAPDRTASDEGELELSIEPATTADGIPDPFELQTRSWNRFLDAQRSFWTALQWPVPVTPWADAANEAQAAEPNVIDANDGPSNSRTAAPAKKRASAKRAPRSR